MPAFLKWTLLTLTAVGLHALVFCVLPSHQAHSEDAPALEIQVDILQDLTSENPNPSLAELERIEQRRLAEEKRKEEARIAEEKRKEAERLAEIKKQAEIRRIAQEKRLAEEKRKKDARIAAEKKRLKEENAQEARELAEQKRHQERAQKKKSESRQRDETAQRAARNKIREADKKRAQEAAKQTALAKKKTVRASATSRRKPTYPRTLQRKGIEGVVKITLQINSSGKVSNAWVSSTSGHPSFDTSALKAARKWKYKPAYNGLGQAIPDQKTETIYFKLQ